VFQNQIIRLFEAVRRKPSGEFGDDFKKTGRLAPLRFLFLKHVLNTV
jgi:hypothetical protein